MSRTGSGAAAIVMGALGMCCCTAALAFAQARWTTVTPLPVLQRTHFAATVDGVVYAGQGGDNTAGPAAGQFFRYDAAAGAWDSLCQPAPGGMIARASAVVQGRLYAFGGESSVLGIGALDYTHVFDPAQQPCGWSAGPDMPGGERESAAAATVDGTIYVLGGYSGTAGVLGRNESYAPATNSWQSRAPMPRRRFVHSAAAVDGKVYVFGGVGEGVWEAVLGEVDVYDPQTDTWTTLEEPMPAPRRSMGIAVMPGACADGTDEILLVGGANLDNSVVHGRVDGFCPATGPHGTWHEYVVPDIPTPRFNLAATIVDRTLFVIGGETTIDGGATTVALDVVESYTIQEADTTPPGVRCAARPGLLWPPNHRLVGVDLTVEVTDAESGPAGFRLVSVASSEPDNGLGDGDTVNDIQGFVPGRASTFGFLRAERGGKGRGRNYTFTYEGADAAGNTATCQATVTVPHSR